MPLIELTAAEEKIVHAARGYADALAVLRGNPPFSTWDALRVTAKRDELLSEALKLSGEREVGLLSNVVDRRGMLRRLP